MLEYKEIETGWPGTAEFAALRVYHPNVLIEGPRLQRDRLLAALRPDIPSFIARERTGRGLALPRHRTGIIVSDVDTLSPTEQDQLYAWTSEGHALQQVVSTSARSVYNLLKSGRFCNRLYYQLNVMLLVVGHGAPAGGA
jgi:hypothetical protein